MFRKEDKTPENAMKKKSKVVIIGASGKKSNEYLAAIMRRDDLEVAGILINKRVSPIVSELEKQGIPVIRDGQIDKLLTSVSFSIAVVGVPHHEHRLITQALLHAGKYVIKEKPLAMATIDAEEYHLISKAKDIPPVFTTLRRNSLPAFLKAKEDIFLIGQPLNFTYDYWFNLPSVTTGWRAQMATAGGGVVLDMGYHAIDVIIKFFGQPDTISALMSYKYQETQQEGLEDYAEISMKYTSGDLQGQLVLDRHANVKKEVFTIHGSSGLMVINLQGYQVFNLAGILIKAFHCAPSKEEETDQMFENALPLVMDKELLNQDFIRNRDNITTIQSIYSCKKIIKSNRFFSQESASDLIPDVGKASKLIH